MTLQFIILLSDISQKFENVNEYFMQWTVSGMHIWKSENIFDKNEKCHEHDKTVVGLVILTLKVDIELCNLNISQIRSYN